jgi:hypothetical protein
MPSLCRIARDRAGLACVLIELRSGVVFRGPNSPGARQSKRGPTEWVGSGRRLVQPDRFGPMFTKPGYLIGAARARLSMATLKAEIVVMVGLFRWFTKMRGADRNQKPC